MAWYKVDDRLPTSRKLMRIPRAQRKAAIGVWTLAGAWSMHEMTDGFVPAYAIEEWGGDDADAQALVRAGMWEEDERDGDHGWQFVNWDEYQPTKADVEARRERDRERKRSQPRGKGGKFAGRTVDATDSARNPDGTGTDSRGNISDSTVPLPSPPHPTPSSAPKRASKLPDSWTPTAEHQAQAAQAGINISLEVEKMRDWALSKGETRKDWNATFRNWLRNARPTPGYTPKPVTGQRVLEEWELRG